MIKSACMATCVLLCGCANFVGNTTMASPEKLRTLSTEELVYGYGYDWKTWGKKNEHIRAELETRAVFSRESWALIDARELQQGCSPAVVMAAWGPPVEKSETRYGSTKLSTWRYGDYSSGDRTLVYFENDRLTGWTQ